MNKIKKWIDFFKSSWIELKNVTWPSRDEITESTFLVVITIVVLSLFLWVIDMGLERLIRLAVGK